ncbi:MAG: hypothetical protein V7637_4485 [Mycobacteriales bacterium]
MPMPVPSLDDKAFDDLVAEGHSLVPRTFPAWTDHNESDPGVTLLELFAFLVESLLYRVDLVPDRTLAGFAGLVGVQPEPGEPVERLLARAAAAAARPTAAVTAADMTAVLLAGVPGLARAQPVVRPDADGSSTVDVLLVPADPARPAPTPTDTQRAFELLRARTLLGTRLRVSGPRYRDVALSVTVVRDVATLLRADTVRAAVVLALSTFLSPLTGGDAGTGWEFGRPVYRSELYALLEGVRGVDHVAQVLLGGDDAAAALPLADDPAVAAASLVALAPPEVTVLDPGSGAIG